MELIIPVGDRKLNGAFFTPGYIIDFIINEIRPKENDTNLEPSCGCGAFLVDLTDYYKRTFNKPIKKIIKVFNPLRNNTNILIFLFEKTS
ncbi:MAG: N-6 DNA methylase [Phycisphaerales bacterium]|nr:N-6 DNA methylase [Phycisphaerales bacterium]